MCTLKVYLIILFVIEINFTVNLFQNFYFLFLKVLATARIYLRLEHICVKFLENFPVALLSFHHKWRQVFEYLYSHVSSRGQRKSHLRSGFPNSKLQLESLGQTQANSSVVELLRAISKCRKRKESSWSFAFTPSTKTRNQAISPGSPRDALTAKKFTKQVQCECRVAFLAFQLPLSKQQAVFLINYLKECLLNFMKNDVTFLLYY